MKRREFLIGGAGIAAGSATTYALLQKNAGKNTTRKNTVEAPMINKGLLRWRLVTTWPKNFPGLGTGANLLGD